MPLRIGTSGWNYPTGKGTWNGLFYPLPEDRERGFDELRFYSERFNAVEVNSTFYGQPRANVTLGWAKRTPPDFEFAVKMFQKFTHPGMSIGQARSVARSVPSQLPAHPGIDRLPRVAAQDLCRLRTCRRVASSLLERCDRNETMTG